MTDNENIENIENNDKFQTKNQLNKPESVVISNNGIDGNNDAYHVVQNEFKFKRYHCTYTLIIVIISIYLITSFPLFIAPNSWYVYSFALIPQALFEGQLWRLITPNFLHANLNHITANAISIIIWGHLLEKIIGTRAMYLLVIISCIFTTLFSAIGTPQTISLGASGIAYALMSAFILYVLFITFMKIPGEFGGQLFSFIVLVLFQVGYNYVNSSTVDIWGHIGGTIAGIAFIICVMVYKYIHN